MKAAEIIKQLEQAANPMQAAHSQRFFKTGKKHVLMHKAVGWLLREMGKRNEQELLSFWDSHAAVMPRTMLRYSIEKLSPDERRYYMDIKQ